MYVLHKSIQIWYCMPEEFSGGLLPRLVKNTFEAAVFSTNTFYANQPTHYLIEHHHSRPKWWAVQNQCAMLFHFLHSRILNSLIASKKLNVKGNQKGYNMVLVFGGLLVSRTQIRRDLNFQQEICIILFSD